MNRGPFEWLPVALLGAALFFMLFFLGVRASGAAVLPCADPNRAGVNDMALGFDRITKDRDMDLDAWLWTWAENPREQFLVVFRSDKPGKVLVVNLANGCETPIPHFGGRSYREFKPEEIIFDLRDAENVFTTGRDMRPKPEAF